MLPRLFDRADRLLCSDQVATILQAILLGPAIGVLAWQAVRAFA